MPPLNENGLYFSMVEEVQNYLIQELRKFFGQLPPYVDKYPTGLIPTDLIYRESSPGVPTGNMNIVDEENFDDRRLPCIILTGFNGDAVELGLGQAGMRPPQTREANTVMASAVRAATVVAGNLTSDFDAGKIIDGVTLAAGNRVLIKNQALPAQNGVYVVQATGAPLRATDFDTVVEFLKWTTIPVTEGTENAGRYFSQVSVPPTTLGVDPVLYDDRGLETLEWDERVGARNINITYSIRARSTSQRARLTDLLMVAVQDKRFVRGEIEKQSVFITPPFVRETGSSEEFTVSPGTDMIYRVDYTSVFFAQWSHRLLKTENVAKAIIPTATF